MRKYKSMKIKMCAYIVLVCFFNFAFVCPVNTTESKWKMFEYDKTLPLNSDEKIRLQTPAYIEYDVSFQSANGEVVPAIFVLPRKSNPPFPCAILMHGYASDKVQNSYAFPTLVERRYAIIAIDAEYHGERKEKGKDLLSLDFDSDVNAFIQTIIDLRRTVDYIETRKEIDNEKIVYLGSSMGAIMGAIFCAVEKRVKACTLFQGGGNWETMLKDSEIGPLADMRKAILAGKVVSSDLNRPLTISEVAEKFKMIDPLNFIGEISPRPLFIANSKGDKVIPNTAGKIFHEYAKEPKKTKWVKPIPLDPTGHSVPMWELITESIDYWDSYLFSSHR